MGTRVEVIAESEGTEWAYLLRELHNGKALVRYPDGVVRTIPRGYWKKAGRV